MFLLSHFDHSRCSLDGVSEKQHVRFQAGGEKVLIFQKLSTVSVMFSFDVRLSWRFFAAQDGCFLVCWFPVD